MSPVSRAQKISSAFRAIGMVATNPIGFHRWKKPFSNLPRKKLNKSFFTFQMWKTAAGKKSTQTHHFLTAESLILYISRIDDVIDQLRSPTFSRDVLVYRKDPLARQHMSDFVRGIRKSSLTPAEKKEIFTMVHKYRFKMKNVLEKFEKLHKPTFEEVVEMRRLTSGETGRVLAAVLNVAENIPREKRAKIERSFVVAFLALQVADDVRDAKEDFAQNVPNLVTSALSQNIFEFIAFKRAKRVNLAWLKKNAPRTYAKVRSLFNDYQASMPHDEAGFRVLGSLSDLAWKLA